MSENDRYHKAIQEHSEQLRKLTEDEKALQLRKQKVLQLIAANVNMLPDAEQERLISKIAEMLPPAGLSDAIMRILPLDDFLGATEVRDKLVENGYDFSGQANPLASIHTTLKRLVESKDAISHVPQSDGKTFYKRAQGAARSTVRLYDLMRSPIRPDFKINDALEMGGVKPSTAMAPRTRKTMGQRMVEREKEK